MSAVTSVDVEVGPDGSLLVRWHLAGPEGAVDVAVGEAADGSDHQHHETVPADRRSVRLAPLGPGRHFVSVAPHDGGPKVVAADRLLAFERAANFRDLGGYPTADGRQVRWGMVFRAGALDVLGPTDVELYERLGIRSVFDLRADAECVERPDAVASRRWTLSGRPPAPYLVPPSTAADGQRRLLEVYCGLLDHGAAALGGLLTELGTEGSLPAVVHCHAGKDRTGVVAALLLEVLGVERDVVLDDYEVSARFSSHGMHASTFQRLLRNGYAEEAAAALLSTSRWAMAGALDHLDRRYSGAEGYLLGAAGMEPSTVGRLRNQLLEPRR